MVHAAVGVAASLLQLLQLQLVFSGLSHFLHPVLHHALQLHDHLLLLLYGVLVHLNPLELFLVLQNLLFETLELVLLVGDY